MSIRAEGTLREALATLASETRLSYVVQASAAESAVSVSLQDVPVPDVVAMLARSAGIEVLWRGGVVYFGSLRPSDKAVAIRRVGRGSADELRELLRAVTKADAVGVTDDGVIVVADTVDAIARVNDVIDQWENAASPVWVVELVAVSVGEQLRRELAIDGTLAGSIALAVSATPSSAVSRPVASAAFEALLAAVDEDGESWVDIRPLVTLADGQTSTVSTSNRVPYSLSVVLENGAVAQKGYEFVEAGTVLKLDLREHGRDAAAVGVALELTDFETQENGPPAVVGSKLETTVVCDAGRTYLIGSIATRSESRKKSSALRFGSAVESGERVIDVYLRAVRLPGPGGQDAAADDKEKQRGQGNAASDNRKPGSSESSE